MKFLLFAAMLTIAAPAFAQCPGGNCDPWNRPARPVRSVLVRPTPAAATVSFRAVQPKQLTRREARQARREARRR